MWGPLGPFEDSLTENEAKCTIVPPVTASCVVFGSRNGLIFLSPGNSVHAVSEYEAKVDSELKLINKVAADAAAEGLRSPRTLPEEVRRLLENACLFYGPGEPLESSVVLPTCMHKVCILSGTA